MERFDVVICGGGLAGLTLARQLRMSTPGLRVAVLDKAGDDIPSAAHKVGESSVEVGAHYLVERLGLRDYLVDNHLPKLGLRFFFKNTDGPLHERMELGPRQFPRFPSVQLDRGVLERDLRASTRRIGVALLDEASVREIELAEGEGEHRVGFVRRGEAQSLGARWVVDATGRRRMLQSSLKLSRDNGHEVSAAWWRMPGRLDVASMVADPQHRWHRQTKEPRWFSTNHFMGAGYWVWLIPLSSGNTSVGIVTDQGMHPLSSYNDIDKARAWLRRHEPQIAALIEDEAPLDFRALKHYSYHSEQIFSARRWSCVGEAGIFLDPFYSPGTDFIAYSNSITTRMIERDLEGTLTEEVVEKFNRVILRDISDNFLAVYRGQYPIFGSAYVMATKVTWDTCYYWAFPGQMFFRGLLTEPEVLDEFHELSSSFLALNRRVQALFRAWAAAERPSADFHYIEYGAMPFFRGLHFDLGTDKTPERCFTDMRKNLAQFEEWAQAIFEAALQDLDPATLRLLPEPLWVDPYAIGSDPARWLADGLFRPPMPPRSLDNFRAQMGTTLVRPSMRA